MIDYVFSNRTFQEINSDINDDECVGLVDTQNNSLHSISRCFNDAVTDNITSVLPSLSVSVSGQTRYVPPSHTTLTISRISGVILNEKGLLVKKTEDNTRGFGNENSDSSNDGSSDDDNQDESKIHNSLLSYHHGSNAQHSVDNNYRRHNSPSMVVDNSSIPEINAGKM